MVCKIRDDDELMLKTLIEFFGEVKYLWDAVHEDTTYLDGDVFNCPCLEENIECLEKAFERATTEIAERELLKD